MSELAGWLDRHTSRAPDALGARVRDEVLKTDVGEPLPAALASAALAALDRVVVHPGDRSAALDLLAADALVTLALLAQAERAPEDLGAFATSLLQAVPPDA
ncbi:MAG TPA: hypothetical protein VF046_05695 [Gemmatimonadales bacterium]